MCTLDFIVNYKLFDNYLIISKSESTQKGTTKHLIKL